MKMSPEAINYLVQTKFEDMFKENEATSDIYLKLDALWIGLPYKKGSDKRSGGLLQILGSEKSLKPRSLRQFLLNPTKFDYDKNNHLGIAAN